MVPSLHIFLVFLVDARLSNCICTKDSVLHSQDNNHFHDSQQLDFRFYFWHKLLRFGASPTSFPLNVIDNDVSWLYVLVIILYSQMWLQNFHSILYTNKERKTYILTSFKPDHFENLMKSTDSLLFLRRKCLNNFKPQNYELINVNSY